jgi:hypothetical protein
MPGKFHPSEGIIPFAEIELPGGSRITLFKEVTVSFIQSLLSNHSYAGSK